MDFLAEIQHEISHGSTDIYEQFWNEKTSKASATPKIENTCRNSLLTLLRNKLNPLNVLAELETQTAQGKRADIMLSVGTNIKLPIECKHQQAKDIWTAMDKQLQRYYAKDPNAKGYGVYLVFWFGPNAVKGAGKSAVKRPPDKSPAPTTAAELQEALTAQVPAKTIKVFVLDVSKKQL